MGSEFYVTTANLQHYSGNLIFLFICSSPSTGQDSNFCLKISIPGNTWGSCQNWKLFLEHQSTTLWSFILTSCVKYFYCFCFQLEIMVSKKKTYVDQMVSIWKYDNFSLYETVEKYVQPSTDIWNKNYLFCLLQFLNTSI